MSPTEKRIVFNIPFIYKVFNGVIYAPNLSSKISLAVSSYFLRNNPIFKIKFQTNVHDTIAKQVQDGRVH